MSSQNTSLTLLGQDRAEYGSVLDSMGLPEKQDV